MPLPESTDKIDNVLQKLIEYDKMPSTTYGIDDDTDQSLKMIDNIEALQQTFMFIVETERNAYPVFSQDFGMDWSNLIGQPDDFIISEVVYRLKDALSIDDRFTDVSLSKNKGFEINGDSITLYIDVETIYGNFSTQLEVQK